MSRRGMCLATSLVLMLAVGSLRAQQPEGVPEILQTLASTPATHTAFTLDREMLQSAEGMVGDPSAAINSITIENFRYREPAFYIPENMASLAAAFQAAGWKHLVEQHAGPKELATPSKPLTDLWLHFNGGDIDCVTVLLRAPRQMTVVEVSGALKPLDLLHLAGHFGIPRVDPGAVMVPAPPAK